MLHLGVTGSVRLWPAASGALTKLAYPVKTHSYHL